jgi:hypothetical protein
LIRVVLNRELGTGRITGGTTVFFTEMVQKQLIEEVEPGQWALSLKGQRRMR